MPQSCNTRNGHTIAKTMGDKVKSQKKTLETNGFKGFDKVPKVILERYNIAPYIKASKTSIPTSDSIKCLKEKYPAFFIKSVVKLTRCDPENLKDNEKNRLAFKYRCKICDKRYPDEKKLRNHHDNKHLIVYGPLIIKPQKRVSFSDHVVVHEVAEYHKCRKCIKIFENYRLLKKHMKESHKKRKCYICNYCTMSFVDRTIFKVHIKLHCDVCHKLFPNKSQYVEHRRLVCKVSNKSFRIIKLNLDLFEKDNPDVKENSFVCDVCHEEFSDKCRLRHHKSFLHLNNRPDNLFETKNIGNECIFVCLFCEEHFVDKELVKKHVELLPDLSYKSVIGTKVSYHCDRCTLIFDIESEMLSHKWSHLLVKNATPETEKGAILNISSENEKNTEKTKEKGANWKIKKDEKVLKCSPKSIAVTDLDKPLHELTADDIASLTKPVVDPKSKITLLSKHQCEECCKFFSSGYCLRRHIERVHPFRENLQCEHCEEVFVWPSLLESHQCLRNPLPELPFDDARPEIFLLNHVQPVQHASEIDGVDINSTQEDYIDFEIPEPIVDLIEETAYNNGLGNDEIRNQDHFNGFQNGGCVENGDASNVNFPKSAEETVLNNNVSLNPALNKLQNLGYKVVMQEVPIEF